TRFSRDWSSDVCSSDLFLALFLEEGEAAVADVHGRAFERGDPAFRGAQVELWNDGFEAFRGDAVDGAGSGFVQRGMTADAWVERSEERRVGKGGCGRVG